MRVSDADTVRKIFERQRSRLQAPRRYYSWDDIPDLELLETLSDSESIGDEVIKFLLGEGFRLASEADVAVPVFGQGSLPLVIAGISSGKLTKSYCRLVLKFLEQRRVDAEQILALTGFFQERISFQDNFLTTAPESLFELFHSMGKKSDFFKEIKVALKKMLIRGEGGSSTQRFVGQCRKVVIEKLGSGHDRVIGELLAEIANEWITTKASVERISDKVWQLSRLITFALKADEISLLKPEAKAILIDFKGGVPRDGSQLCETKLLFVRHGFSGDTINACEIFSLVREKLRGGSPDLNLLEEILDADSYLMKFIRLGVSGFAQDHLQSFVGFVLAVSEAALSTGNRIDSLRLLNFLRTYIPSSKSPNIGHVFVQCSTNPSRSSFFDLLKRIAREHAMSVLSYLYLKPLEFSRGPNFGALTLNNYPNNDQDYGICADEKAAEKHINLLEFISMQLGKEAVAEFVRDQHDSFGVSLNQLFPKRTDLVLRLILNEFLTPEALDKLKGVKHAVTGELIKYCRTLEGADAVALLRSALARDTYLGSYFYLQRSSKPCALGQHGALDTIFAELKKIDPVAAAGFAPAATASSSAVSLFGRSRARSVDGLGAVAIPPDDGFELTAFLSGRKAVGIN